MTLAIDQIAEQSESIGYRADAIRRNYAFSDITDERPGTTRLAPLAVFTQTPPSYRSAAFGVAENSVLEPEATVQSYRSLGAPIFFVVENDDVAVWQVYAKGPPREVQRTTVAELPSLFQAHSEVWEPDAIHRAKSIGQLDTTYQLDFVDAGLIPALEGQIHEKLDRLLREALAATRKKSDDPNIRFLLQGVFRLLAAKILIDRGHESSTNWDPSDVTSVLSGIGNYYRLPHGGFDISVVEPDLKPAWSILLQGLNVANISADDLAFVYENTLVTPKTRRLFGTHSTPRHVAEYIVRRLGLWRNEMKHPIVFEPFAGAGVFLVSALRHMRESLPISWSDRQRHDLLVQNIYGSEIDAFAREVAMLSLILADYPNTNGWKIDDADLFRGEALESRLASADVVLCNPPFAGFTDNERTAYPIASARGTTKALSVLTAVLDAQPQALGFVLPHAFLSGRAYRNHRKTIEESYREIELVSLPDGVFSVSQVETALLIARDRRLYKGDRRIISSEVDDCHKRRFLFTGLPSRTREELRTSGLYGKDSLWIPPLASLWRRLESLPRIGDYFSGHWGIRWADGGQSRASVEGPGRHHKLGLLRVQDHRQFRLGQAGWINIRKDDLYAGGRLPWPAPKILCNAVRLSRSYWRFAAAVDNNGLVASQQFVALWSKEVAQHTDLDAIAAILNGPIANAFMTDHSKDRRFRISTILSIPLPSRIPKSVGILAREYGNMIRRDDSDALQHDRLTALLDQIDQLVLDIYDLTPKLVRSLLAAFKSNDRPVTHSWNPWNVNSNQPALNLKELRTSVLDVAMGNWVRKELVPVSDQEAARAASYLP